MKSGSRKESLRRALFGWGLPIVLAAIILTAASLFLPNEYVPLRVELGSRSLSKLPFFVALDRGLYKKHGLDVHAYMPQPEFPGGKTTLTKYVYFLTEKLRIRKWHPEVTVRGGNSYIVKTVKKSSDAHLVILASNDCVVRTRIVAAKGMNNLQELKGKRIGVSSVEGNTGFAARVLAERMGWNPLTDMSIAIDSNELDALRDGHVDALFANERSTPIAMEEGYPVLADLREWGPPSIIGNSIRVNREWLNNPQNRETTLRFLKATAEGLALFKQDPDLVLNVLEKWYGVTDKTKARIIYEDGRWLPAKPYPCYEGIERTMELYDSEAMSDYDPEDFYDDSLVRELDESGFIDSLYLQPE